RRMTAIDVLIEKHLVTLRQHARCHLTRVHGRDAITARDGEEQHRLIFPLGTDILVWRVPEDPGVACERSSVRSRLAFIRRCAPSTTRTSRLEQSEATVAQAEAETMKAQPKVVRAPLGRDQALQKRAALCPLLRGGWRTPPRVIKLAPGVNRSGRKETM